jgi:ATP-binding protein involved in chromosome partitioning
MRRLRSYREVEDAAGAEVLGQVMAQRRRLAERLAGVRHVIGVASGKGGVGKSAITANLAVALAARGRRVGAADADLNGPSLARMLAAPGEPLRVVEAGIVPAMGLAGVRLVSMDLLLAAADAPLQWRGPSTDSFLWRGALETGALREFLSDVVWGELDYLLIDVPPGTDRIERLLDLVPSPAAILLVSTPSLAARHVVRKSARLLAEAGVANVGLIENMSRYRCPCCGCDAPLFAAEGARADVPATGAGRWAEIPFDPAFAAATDAGQPFVLAATDSPTTHALHRLADRVEEECRP